MYSLVLKPWRCCAVFLTVIPGVAPSSGLRGTGALATGAPRRAAARGAGDALRRAPAEVFLGRRDTAEVFLCVTAVFLWRVFPATELAWVSRPWFTVPRKHPEKIRSQRGSGSGAVICSFSNYIAHFQPKSKLYDAAKSLFGVFSYYIFVTAG